jgi:hypothetical protein
VWSTYRTQRTVLAVVRTVTSTRWLLEILPELFRDHRIQTLFTIGDERSAFDEGAIDLVRAAGGRVVPWSQAIETSFDLAVCATHTGPLADLRAPLLLLPHGPGYSKPISVAPADEVPVPRHPDAAGRARGPRTTILISHSDEARLFGRYDPQEVQFLAAGDPMYDRIRVSATARERYRAALGVSGRRLVLMVSTWGPESLAANYPELPARIVAELPADEYSTVLSLHSNVWFGHGEWQVRGWLARAREAGLAVVPPGSAAWAGVAVAADLVIGDHGAVTFYGACTGNPVLMVPFDPAAVYASSPVGRLSRLGPRLDPARTLRPQIDEAIEAHLPGAYHDLVDTVFSTPGRSLEVLRERVYELIDLPLPPDPPRVLALPNPMLHRRDVTAHLVHARVGANRDDGISVTRFPAALTPPPPPPPPKRESGAELLHLAVDWREVEERLLQVASIVFVRPHDLGNPRVAQQLADDLLRKYPACRVAAVLVSPASAVAFFRAAEPVRAQFVEDPDPSTPDPALLASAAYVCDVVGWLEDRFELRVGTGSRSHRVVVEPLSSQG